MFAANDVKVQKTVIRAVMAFKLLALASLLEIVAMDLTLLSLGRLAWVLPVNILHVYFLIFSLWAAIEAKRSSRRVRTWSAIPLLATVGVAAVAAIVAPIWAAICAVRDHGLGPIPISLMILLGITWGFCCIVAYVWITWIAYMRTRFEDDKRYSIL